MNAYTIIQFVIAVAVLLSATIIDLKKHKIPNFLTFPFMLLSLVLACYFSLNVVWESLIGIVILFGIGIIRAMGMGDIKLLMGLTLLSGWRISLMTLTFGMIIFLLYEFSQHPRKICEKGKMALQAVWLRSPSLIGDKASKKPFALYLTIGYITAYILMEFTHVLEVF